MSEHNAAAAVEATPLRTPEEPMAFTRHELWRGGRRTWFVFLIELTLLLSVPSIVSAVLLPADQYQSRGSSVGMIPVFLMYGLFIGAPVSLLAMFAGTPLAGAVGRAMRRIRSLLPHALAQAAVGAFMGALVGLIFAAVINGNAMPEQFWSSASWLMLWGAGLTIVAAVIGWWWTVHLALRDDSRGR
ncbi:hypothetical protein GCM10025768_18300 [Microbacterium pseudoresistens]|uniref:Uncharacterized protein n=1 Tax=Microbacterium pseudoresistens TaxID=640634 RepID=A0A7Y9JQB6_9MICO|nr:hypothetical protein [Microbacterium pseudoresistens]NYD55524.1 hypothetical protein [Microbacterium pseudoresistens]